jgi:hypothetical protein
MDGARTAGGRGMAYLYGIQYTYRPLGGTYGTQGTYLAYIYGTYVPTSTGGKE